VINNRKLVRDIVVVLVIVVGAVFLLRYQGRESSPPDRTASTSNQANSSQLPQGHGGQRPELSAGEPLLKVGDMALGKDWFDDFVTRVEAESPESEGTNPTANLEFAQMQALIEGLARIVEARAEKEFGLQIDDEITQREQEFSSQFKSDEEKQQFLEQNGVGIDQLQELWRSEITKKALIEKLAQMSGVDPNSPEGEKVYEDWVKKSVNELDIQFVDPATEALYRKCQEFMSEMESNPASVVDGESAVGANPHEGLSTQPGGTE
jgi:hypothetical protein